MTTWRLRQSPGSRISALTTNLGFRASNCRAQNSEGTRPLGQLLLRRIAKMWQPHGSSGVILLVQGRDRTPEKLGGKRETVKHGHLARTGLWGQSQRSNGHG